MNFLNLGIGEILFILVIAVIIFGPGNMVKTARDLGAFVRKVAKSPYWQEVWATKRELTELPKLISKEARLDETLSELNKDTQGIKSKFS
ncbi:MAG: twin-arginine translocase TatA/TatE family subunit, partial [Anaerolineaceae bacterium]|nr:twin-arginine translocase TatA/TatE family subunit [Anaerolineaceae bacterium]